MDLVVLDYSSLCETGLEEVGEFTTQLLRLHPSPATIYCLYILREKQGSVYELWQFWGNSRALSSIQEGIFMGPILWEFPTLILIRQQTCHFRMTEFSKLSRSQYPAISSNVKWGVKEFWKMRLTLKSAKVVCILSSGPHPIESLKTTRTEIPGVNWPTRQPLGFVTSTLPVCPTQLGLASLRNHTS